MIALALPRMRLCSSFTIPGAGAGARGFWGIGFAWLRWGRWRYDGDLTTQNDDIMIFRPSQNAEKFGIWPDLRWFTIQNGDLSIWIMDLGMSDNGGWTPKLPCQKGKCFFKPMDLGVPRFSNKPTCDTCDYVCMCSWCLREWPGGDISSGKFFFYDVQS